MPLSPLCPQPTRLRQLLASALPDEEQAVLTEHLDGCATCQQTLEELAAGREGWTGRARLLARSRPATEEALRRAVEELKGEADPVDLLHPAAREELLLDFLQPSDRPGHLGRLGRYEVTEVIGRGGMGVVLKAFDEALHRVVAIKALAPQLATSATARRRFEREGRAAAAVTHEHVVTIHAVDTAAGLPYLVMQYVSGISLQEKLDRTGPLGPTEILRIGMQAASGLAAAHAQGLIHRDIKPANILLENGVERVKLTDFGLARAVDDATVTQSGTVTGTPEYMSPEQADGGTLDHRADLFSLGSVLYALCTGRPPFRGPTTAAVLRRVAQERPRPLREINPDIPEWLAAIIEKLHAKDPAGRYPSAAAVAEVLGRGLAHVQQPLAVPPPCPPEAAPRSRPAGRAPGRRLLVAAGVFLLLLGGLAVSEATGRTEIAKLVATVLRIRTADGMLVVTVDDPQVTVNIDGGDVVITGTGPHEVRLRAGQHRLQATKDGLPVRSEVLTISRDEKKIVTVREEPAAQPGVGQAGAPSMGRGAAWADLDNVGRPDLIMTPQGVIRWPPAAGIIRESRRISGHTADVSQVVITPDGRHILSSSLDKTLRLWDVATGKEIRRFEGHTGGVQSVALTPDGRRALSGSRDNTLRVWDVATGKELGRLDGHTSWVQAVAFSSDLRHAVSASLDKTVRLWDTGTLKEVRRFTGHTDGVTCVVFSADGKRALSGSWDKTARLWDVASGKELRKFEGHTAWVYGVALSPDGRFALTGGWDNTMRLWDVETGKEVRRFTGHNGGVNEVRFTPDGRGALSTSWDGTVRWWDVATGKELRRFVGHHFAVWTVALSPDGRYLVSGDSGVFKDGEYVPGPTGFALRLWAVPPADPAAAPGGARDAPMLWTPVPQQAPARATGS